ncbi:MAG: DUF3575 domain-containing protein [Candidatus Goldbacteria bacterium]|nr:DUF3575 domain-containing protein [Candidatus Goldiibacteriota bacterium]
MKKVVFLCVVVVFVFVGVMFGNTKSGVEKAIKGEDVVWTDVNQFISTNPLALAFSQLNAHYEFNLSKGSGLGFNAGLIFWGFGDWSTFGLLLGAEYNFYFQNHAPNGWFVGPGAGITYLNVKYQSDSASTMGFNINGHGGYRWIWDNGFLVDVQLGIQYIIINISINNTTIPFGGLAPYVGASIGYAWK